MRVCACTYSTLPLKFNFAPQHNILGWHSLLDFLQMVSEDVPPDDVKLPHSQDDPVGMFLQVLLVHFFLEQTLWVLGHQGQVVILREGKGIGVEGGHCNSTCRSITW